MSKDHSSVDLRKDFMAHYGVKGMHWGIRNDPVPTANSYKGIIDSVKKSPSKKKLLTRLNAATAYASQNRDRYLAVRYRNDITVLTGQQFIDSVLQNNGLIAVSNISPIDLRSPQTGDRITEGA